MRLRLSPVLMAFAAAQAVEIVPPSPYMSSPPPVQADTSVIDPGRAPKLYTVEPGIKEQWFSGWNLTGDHPLSAPLGIEAPQRDKVTFHVAFNDHGWPTDVNYFDASGSPRWTKLFRYPTKIAAGPGDVSFTTTWINSNGEVVSMSDIASTFKSTSWKVGFKKYKVSDLLGEPMLVDRQTGSGGVAEVWSYLVDGREVRFSFDKDNKLVALPVYAEAAAPAEVVTPAGKSTKK
jgi:hypothetical protein